MASIVIRSEGGLSIALADPEIVRKGAGFVSIPIKNYEVLLTDGEIRRAFALLPPLTDSAD